MTNFAITYTFISAVYNMLVNWKSPMVSIYRFVLKQKLNKKTRKMYTVAEPVIEKITVSQQIRDIISTKPAKFLADGEEVLLNGDNNNIIQIDVSKIKDTNLAAKLLTDRYYMRGKGKNMKLYVVQYDVKHFGQKVLVPIFGSDKAIQERENMVGFCRFGGPEGGQISTNSNIKKGVLTMLNNNNPERIHKAMDQIDFGCLSAFIGKTVSFEKAVKLASRLGNWMAVANDGPSVDNFAIYFGEFANGNLDGMSFTTLVKAGQTVQNRAYLCKTLSLGVSDKTMDTIMNSLDSDPIVIDRADITDDLNKEIRTAIDCKGEGTRFAGRVLVIKGNDNGVDYLADMNALKASFNLTRVSNLNIVKVFANKEIGASLSSQILTKMLFQNPENAKKLYLDCHEKALKDSFNFRAMEATEENIHDDIIFPNAILGIDANAKTKYGWIFRRAVDQVLQGDRRALNEFHTPIDGSYKALIGDIGALFGVKLLNADEVFSNGLITMKQYTSIKFPSFDQREYANVRNIGDVIYDRIADAVNDGKLTKEQGAMLHDLCQDLGKAIVMYPAMPIIKNRQAGLDFDGDCAVFIKADLLGLKDAPVAIKCEPPTSKDASQTKIGYDIMAQAMAKIWSFGNLSVGTVTNIFAELQYMELNKDIKKFTELARKFLNLGGTEKYVPVLGINGTEDGVDYIDVSEEKIRAIFDQIPHMALTESNIMTCLHDINHGVGRWYQEGSTDAVKKFYQIVVPMALQELKKQPVYAEVKINWQKRVINKVASDGLYKDAIRRDFQLTLVEQTKEMTKKVASIVCKMPDMDEDVKEMCREFYAEQQYDIKKSIAVLISEIRNAGTIYHETKNGDLYQNMLSNIENMFRLVTFNFDPRNRIAVLLGHDLDQEKQHPGKEVYHVTDVIGTKILREEFVQFVTYFVAKDADEEHQAELHELNESMEVEADPSVMIFRVSVKATKEEVASIKAKLDADDAIVQTGRKHKGSAVIAAVNGEILKYRTIEGFESLAFVDCGMDKGVTKFTRLSNVLTDRKGSVANTTIVEGNNGYTNILVTLYNVSKVTVKKEEGGENAAH